MTDEQTLDACRREVIEVLKRHDVCGAFTLQRPPRYAFYSFLSASFSAINETEDEHRLAIDGKTRDEFAVQLSATLSMLKALGDGQEKSAAQMRAILASLEKHLIGLGIVARNRGPYQGPVQ